MSNKTRKILLLPGDGIGPEVVAEVRRILEWMNKAKSLDFVLSQELIGGASIDANKVPITDEVFYKSLESDAVILGACGGPKWDNLEFSKKPERALLKLRKELKLFANLRPAICFKQLVDSSTLKPEIVSGLDIMIVRELTGGIYFGEPRGIEPMENNQRKGINTHSYTTAEIQRIARVAFPVSFRLSRVSLGLPSLFVERLIPSEGGVLDTTDTELIGARFGIPSFDIVDTRIRGLGEIIAESHLARS